MSTAKFDTLQNAAGTVSVPVNTVVNGSAKAWVNFNGTGTVAIRAGFNVSSITDEGTGQYRVNFTTAMPDANYGFQVRGQGTTYGAVNIFNSGNVAMYFTNAAADTYVDITYVSVAIFR